MLCTTVLYDCGLWFYAYSAALPPTLTGNTISENGREGIEIYVYQPMTPTLTEGFFSPARG